MKKENIQFIEFFFNIMTTTIKYILVSVFLGSVTLTIRNANLPKSSYAKLMKFKCISANIIREANEIFH